VFWGNSSEISITLNSLASISNSIIAGDCPANATCTNVINIDPLFVDQPTIALGSTGDLRLQECSPAINAGTNTGAPTTDLDGNVRPFDPFGFGAVADIGAYEFSDLVDYCTVCEAIAGSLTKTPAVDALCEGEDVSAELTPGSGGNGIDSLAYRTQNAGGSWSAWMEYSSGDPIATTGILSVEIHTVRKSDYCDYSDPETASWTIFPTTVAGSISGASDIDYGSSTGDLVLSGNVGDVVKWQRRFGTSGGWTDILHTDLVYSETPASLGTWQYRALVQSGVCSQEFTEPHSVLVGTKELTIGGSFTANDKIYDDNTDATFDVNSLELVGMVGLEDVSLAGLEIDFEFKIIGTHTVTITNALLTGADKDNYSLSLDGAPETTATINAGPAFKFLVTNPEGGDISSPKLHNIPFDTKVTLVDAFDNPTPNLGGDVIITLTGSGGATPGDLRFQGFPLDPVTQTLIAGDTILSFVNVLYTGVSVVTGFDVKVSASASGTGSADGKTGESNLFSVRDIFFSIEADPISIIADGASKSNLTVTLKDHENNPIPSQNITIETDLGTLMEGLVELSGVVSRNTDANGNVFLQLRSDNESAIATVTAKCPGACPQTVEVAFTLNSPVITGFTPGELEANIDFTPPTNLGITTISNYEYSLNNGTDWTTFNPALDASPVTISGLTDYQTYPAKLRAINEAGIGAASQSFDIYACANPTLGGEIADDQFLFEGDTPDLLTNVADASNNYGVLEYKWQSSTTSDSDGFADILDAVDSTFQSNAVFQTTWFRRLARVSCKSDWIGAAVSNVVQIYVYQPPTIAIVTPMEGDNIYDYPMQVSGTASDPDNDLSEILVRVNGDTWQLATGTENWSIDLPLTFGNQKIEAKAVDAQSLESDLAEANIFVGVQLINLHQGWSIISSYLDPLDNNIENIMEEPVNQSLLNLMLSLNTNFYWPGQNINTLLTWQTNQGYKLNMFGQSELAFTGNPLSETWQSFSAGKYYLPVRSNVPTEISDALGNPEQDVTVIFEGSTNTIYWPEGGIYTLSTFNPGFGYMASFKYPVTVTFNDFNLSPTDKATPMLIKPAQGPWPLTRTGNTHLISVFEEAMKDLQKYAYIGAFNSEGLCIGFCEISNANQNVLLTVYGDDAFTGFKDGAESSELISFRAYDSSSGLETELKPIFSQSFANHDGLFENEGLSAITGFKEAATGISETGIGGDVQIYPNPAKEVVNISLKGFSTLEGFGTLLTAEGREVKTFDLTGEKTTVNISNLLPGVYLLKLETKKAVVIKRFVIL
ncbi:MAG: T9SS type A sorting domain-containing protein, partial [Bacteroidales bacterium]|nr:T9SS type A sorting domain-containing protein [Bacteroidales bacterium]